MKIFVAVYEPLPCRFKPFQVVRDLGCVPFVYVDLGKPSVGPDSNVHIEAREDMSAAQLLFVIMPISKIALDWSEIWVLSELQQFVKAGVRGQLFLYADCDPLNLSDKLALLESRFAIQPQIFDQLPDLEAALRFSIKLQLPMNSQDSSSDCV